MRLLTGRHDLVQTLSDHGYASSAVLRFACYAEPQASLTVKLDRHVRQDDELLVLERVGGTEVPLDFWRYRQ